MECIIYGLGSGRILVEKYINNNMKIIGYSDTYYKGSSFNNKKFYTVDELENIAYNYIIIAIGDKQQYNKVYEFLKGKGIESKKIVKFFEIYESVGICQIPPYKRKDDILKYDTIDGIILGISHGRDAIDVNLLKGNFYNCAIGSQDIYYNLKQIQYIKNNYYNKISNLKYLIIDMYTYTYFNFDVSLSASALNYYSQSEFTDDVHNFKYNKIFTEDLNYYLDDIISRRKYYKRYHKLFNESFNKKFDFDYWSGKKISEEEIRNIPNMKYNSIQTKVFEDTIKNNIKYFELLLSICKEINKDVKIYLILIPQYIDREKAICGVEAEWKKKFYDIVNNIKKKYNYTILDFKNEREISGNRNYYYNYGHLNKNGAREFTKLLNSYLF